MLLLGYWCKRAEFQNDATRKHFVTRQDVSNVKDLAVIRNQEDAVAVDIVHKRVTEGARPPHCTL